MTDLTAAVLTIGPDDPANLADLLPPPDLVAPDPVAPDLVAPDLAEPETTEPEVISPEVWDAQWTGMHDVAGAVIEMRGGLPCPLGDQARSMAGVTAGRAIYDLALTTPGLRAILLSPQSGFIAALGAIVVHGVQCAALVRRSLTPPAPDLAVAA